jgi:mannose-6-phosphate isomerase
LAEVQQQSNLTFRLFDWGRVDASGQPRPVHLRESMDCTDFARGPVFPVKPVRMSGFLHSCEELVRCSDFVIRRHSFSEPIRIVTEDRFRILISLQGNALLTSAGGSAPLKMGSTVLLPASAESAQVTPDGPMVLLEVFCP